MIFEQIQKATLCDQVEEVSRENRVCPTCRHVRALDDYRTRVLYSLFGQGRLKAARLRRCFCDAKSTALPGGFISLLFCFFPDRATQELQRLHVELGARHSFPEAVRLMQSLLPYHPPHHMTVRSRLGRISETVEQSAGTSGDPVQASTKGGPPLS